MIVINIKKQKTTQLIFTFNRYLSEEGNFNNNITTDAGATALILATKGEASVFFHHLEQLDTRTLTSTNSI